MNYFERTGKHQALNDVLESLVPDVGDVPNKEQNPLLEHFRIASNAYYDLYNNGGGNRDGDILFYAGLWDGAECNRGCFHDGGMGMLGGYEWQEVADKFEPRMDTIIYYAAIEQLRALNELRNL